MRIAMVGAGGVGAYLGVLLAERGNDVVLIDRGEHVRALATEGVTIRSRARGELHARLPATDDPAEVGPVDLIVYGVKTYHNSVAIPAMRLLVGPETSILTVHPWKAIEFINSSLHRFTNFLPVLAIKSTEVAPFSQFLIEAES